MESEVFLIHAATPDSPHLGLQSSLLRANANGMTNTSIAGREVLRCLLFVNLVLEGEEKKLKKQTSA